MATLDEDSADDDELSSEFASELSLETELSELASLDEPASPAGRLLELADSELEEFSDELELSELDEISTTADALDSEDELLLVIISGTATELSEDELDVEFAVGATYAGSTLSFFSITGV